MQGTFTTQIGPTPAQQVDPATLYGALLNIRSPGLMAAGGGLGPKDRPFLGMAPGVIPIGDAMFPNGTGINDTFLRSSDPAAPADPTGQGGPLKPRLFMPSRYFNPQNLQQLVHPYLQYEMLNKIYNNLTSRSNVFAVWCTIGFFQVVDDTVTPPKLGPETNTVPSAGLTANEVAWSAPLPGPL